MARSLSPPRPSFLAASDRRSSSSADDATDSDRESAPRIAPVARRVPRSTVVGHSRRRSSIGNQYFPPPERSPTPTDTETWSPQSLYARPPPSSFAFPFQAHPGNPDPIPGRSSRRSSLSSLRPVSTDLSHGHDQQSLPRPNAPFMADSSPSSSPHSTIYRASAASAISEPEGHLRSSPSTASFRAPFLSPASRPSSTFWSPPSYTNLHTTNPSSPNGSQFALALPPSKPPAKSTRLTTKPEKPWLSRSQGRERASWWLTVFFWFLGLGGAAVLCWTGLNDVFLLKDSDVCLYMSEDFNSDSLDTANTWNLINNLGGFGNGEFEMTTNSSDNLFLKNGQLYIYPTLTSDALGSTDKIFDGGQWDLGSGCSTPKNASACSVKSNAGKGVVINPVQSARISTQGKFFMTYGKVQVKAKLPQGDWLWPAIWMLPEDNSTNNPYGAWPMSGEIDIMEARGNGPEYTAQGRNFVRSSVNYGPLPSLFKTIFGWYSLKQRTFADEFHTYTLEWTPEFMRFYTDSRLNSMLEFRTRSQKESFWTRAGFPQTAQNGSTEAVVQNIYKDGSNSAPFDQSFYLILNVAAGGTSGWFPDNVGDKPWHDGSATAMHDFARAQSTWFSTWPTSQESRSFRIDSVKMWKLKGQC